MADASSAPPRYLYHWTRSTHRASVLREGLRRCSWSGQALVLYACDEDARLSIRSHVADRHNVASEYMDCWMFAAPVVAHYRRGNGIYCVQADVPPEMLVLVSKGRLPRGEAV